MNLFLSLTNPLTLKPVVRVEENRLFIRSSAFQQLFSLFSYRKDMLVDVDAQTVVIYRRMLWFLRREWTIPFARIKRIDYGFSAPGEESFNFAIEFYTVSLMLIEPEETVKLFSFVGEYSEQSQTATQSLLDQEGNYIWRNEGGQAATSREFVLLLKQFTGVPLV